MLISAAQRSDSVVHTHTHTHTHIYIYIYIFFFHILFHYGLHGPCCLSILMYNNLPLLIPNSLSTSPHPPPPWEPQVLNCFKAVLMSHLGELPKSTFTVGTFLSARVQLEMGSWNRVIMEEPWWTASEVLVGGEDDQTAVVIGFWYRPWTLTAWVHIPALPRPNHVSSEKPSQFPYQ